MLDLRAELLSVRNEWNNKYISIYDLFLFLSEQNNEMENHLIAEVLLAKFDSLNLKSIERDDYPEIFQELDIDNYTYKQAEWVQQYGIGTFKKQNNTAITLEYTEPNLFFGVLEYIKNSQGSILLPYPLDLMGVSAIEIKNVFVYKEQMERLLGTKIEIERDKDNDIIRACKRMRIDRLLDVANEQKQKISELKNHITELEKLKPISQEQTNEIIQSQADQIIKLQARIAELEQKNQSLKQAETGNKPQRISQPQRDIFTLLTVKNYPNCNSRNELFSVINADLRANGITTKDIQYSTLDRLIDENIRIGSPIRSPFPPKQN